MPVASYGLTAVDTAPSRQSIIAGYLQPVQEKITVISGQNLPLGQVLGRITASGKLTAFAAGASDGSQTAVGILGEAVNATGGDLASFMYVMGEFDRALVTGLTTAAEASLKALNVYIRDLI